MTKIFPPRNLPGSADKWGREVENSLDLYEKRFSGLEQTVNNSDRATSGQLAVLSRQIESLSGVIRALPVTVSSSGSGSNFALSGSAVTKLTVTVPVPQGKTRAEVSASAYMHVLDTTTGGVTSARLRVGVAGNYSAYFWSAKDAGASQVLNVMNGFQSRSFAVSPGGSFDVTVQAYGLNGAAFPTNSTNYVYASVLTTFS